MLTFILIFFGIICSNNSASDFWWTLAILNCIDEAKKEILKKIKQ